nr:putative ribonuclease H-like domain-containing protein [Tanacetum cinerariifolium]
MLDYGFNLMNTKIYIDNESTICIVKNPVFHSKTKHIEIRHHFIRDSYEKKLIQVIKIHTDHNVSDLLTKAFDAYTYYCQMKVNAAKHKLSTAGDVNEDVQIRALIDEKKLIVNEASIRRGLKLEDAKDQRRLNEKEMFGVDDLDGHEVIMDVTTGENVEQDATVAEKEVSTVASDYGTTIATTPQITKDELTLARTLIEIKAAKLKARGVIVQDPSEFRTTSSSQPSQLPRVKDKGKGIMVQPEKPLKKKEQIMMDEEVARKLGAQMKVEMEEEERIEREKDEANIALIEEWDNDVTVVEKEVSAAADEVVTTAESVEAITAAITPQISKDDVILAQTLIEIKEAKPGLEEL